MSSIRSTHTREYGQRVCTRGGHTKGEPVWSSRRCEETVLAGRELEQLNCHHTHTGTTVQLHIPVQSPVTFPNLNFSTCAPPMIVISEGFDRSVYKCCLPSFLSQQASLALCQVVAVQGVYMRVSVRRRATASALASSCIQSESLPHVSVRARDTATSSTKCPPLV